MTMGDMASGAGADAEQAVGIGVVEGMAAGPGGPAGGVGSGAPDAGAPGAGAPGAGAPGGVAVSGAGAEQVRTPGAAGGTLRPLELLHGVEMAVTVELGRTRVAMRDLLAMRAGSIIELDRAAGGPVDVVVNGTLLARGEVVVVDDELGVRITEVVTSAEER